MHAIMSDQTNKQTNKRYFDETINIFSDVSFLRLTTNFPAGKRAIKSLPCFWSHRKNRIEFWLGLLLLVFVGVLSRDTSFRFQLFFMKLFGSLSSFKVLPRSVKYMRIVFLSYSGHHFVAVRDGDFLFTYCLWFQDNNGNPVPVNCSLPVGVGSSPTGILSSTYFKWV